MSVEKDVSPPNQNQWLWQNTMTKATRTKGVFGLRVTVPEGESTTTASKHGGWSRG